VEQLHAAPTHLRLSHIRAHSHYKSSRVPCVLRCCSGGPAPDEGSYELPDGNVLKLSGLRQTIPELLFSAEATDPFRHLLSLRSTSAWLLYYNAGEKLLWSVLCCVRLPEACSVRQPVACSTQPVAALPGRTAGISMRLLSPLPCPALPCLCLSVSPLAGISMRLPEPAAASSLPIPLPKMVHGALLNSSPEIRRELCHNVLLTGAGANLRNVQERLKWELLAVIPAAFKPRVVGPSPVEREFAPWIGGSVLGACATAVATLRVPSAGAGPSSAATYAVPNSCYVQAPASSVPTLPVHQRSLAAGCVVHPFSAAASCEELFFAARSFLILSPSYPSKTRLRLQRPWVPSSRCGSQSWSTRRRARTSWTASARRAPARRAHGRQR
jgi:hypothetical protein